MNSTEILKAVTSKPQTISELAHRERNAECLKTARQILTMFKAGQLDRDSSGRYFPKMARNGTETAQDASKRPPPYPDTTKTPQGK